MDLMTYISDRARKLQLARDAQVDPNYLWQVATHWRGRQASPALATRIEAATGGHVKRRELRPDVYGDVPEAPKNFQASTW